MFKNLQIWLLGYIWQELRRLFQESLPTPTHIIFCIVDHFEPRRGGVSIEKEIARVYCWIEKYRQIVSRHRDYSGGIVQYSIFYPIDEYNPEVLERISDFLKRGYGEIEIQLHHDNDTSHSLEEKLNNAKEIFSKFGLLGRDKSSNDIRYGFVHGNWALDNSRRDGRWCGVNNELEILRQTGCYADFTLPSAPSETQTSKINSIYYAKDTPLTKSHNSGIDVEVGKSPSGDLMIIQGPLALNWQRRKFGILPRIENAEITLENPPTRERIDIWIHQRISVRKKPDWIFVKVFTHGLKDNNLKDEYFVNLDAMFSYLETKYNDGKNFILHYVTARQMYNIIKAAEAGQVGNPTNYKDYLIARP